MKESRNYNHGIIECLPYLKKYEELCQRRSYRARRRWGRSKAKEGHSKNKYEYFHLHWISLVPSLKTPKDMSDEMIIMYKYDLENSTQECEAAMS